MRIIAGKHRGRNLLSPLGKGIRPTSSKMRESIFNILASMNALEDAKVIDLCCGTGALGIEALSRGANSVVFIDGSSQHLQLAWQNICQLGEQDNSIMLRASAEALPKAKDIYNLVFIDPPYFKAIADKALVSLAQQGWLAESAIIVVEMAHKEDLQYSTDIYQEISTRKYGNSKIILLERL